jgi:branched-chain amino acid transport system substrate-binding protein
MARLLQGLALSVVILALAGCSQKTVTEPIWIGHLAPLSGPDKWKGDHARQGVDLAVEETKNEKRVGGQPVEFRHANTRGEADRLQAEAVRLLTVNKVVALLDGSDPALAERLAPTAQPYAVPVVVAAELPGPADLVFSLGAGPPARAKALARFAGQELKAKKAVVLTDGRLPLAVNLARAFVLEWTKAKAPVEEWTFRADAELADFLSHTAKAKPDVVLFAGSVADLTKAHSQLEAAGSHGPLLFGGEDAGEETLRALPEGAAGVYLATAFTTRGLSEKGKAFARRYEERFHEAPDLYAAQAYDGARLLIEALHRAGTTTTAKVREELSRVENFDCVTGPLSIKDQCARRRVFVIEVEKGMPRLAKEYPAEE